MLKIFPKRRPLRQGCKTVHYRGADRLQPRVQDPQKRWIPGKRPRVRIHLPPPASRVRTIEGSRLPRMRVGARRVDRIYEGVDHADRIVLIDPVVQGFRKKRPLSAIRPLYEA